MVLNGLRHHVALRLQNKLAVDELSDALNVESHLGVHNTEVLIQTNVHGLKTRDELLDVDAGLLHLELNRGKTLVFLLPFLK